MTRTEPIQGAYTALLTPFRESNSRIEAPVALDTLYELIDAQINAGIDGVVVLGCTGYDAYFTHEEHIGIFRDVASKYGDTIPLIAGDGANITREAIYRAQATEDAGIFTHLSVSPYKVKPSNQGILEHYLAIADAIEGELIVYSVPGRTGGLGILPEVAEELARHPRIIGIKDASGDTHRISEIIQRTKAADPNFSVLSGNDADTVSTIMSGGDGVVSVVSNVLPEMTTNITRAALRGDYRLAESLDSQLRPVYNALFPSGENPSPNPALLYHALKDQGFNVGTPPLPLTEATPEEIALYNNALMGLREQYPE
ncbi:MAG: 4-hydroxy-tetrahydrodipicolinate synthase [Candidatus Woesearchaeota archaeon]